MWRHWWVAVILHKENLKGQSWGAGSLRPGVKKDRGMKGGGWSSAPPLGVMLQRFEDLTEETAELGGGRIKGEDISITIKGADVGMTVQSLGDKDESTSVFQPRGRMPSQDMFLNAFKRTTFAGVLTRLQFHHTQNIRCIFPLKTVSWINGLLIRRCCFLCSQQMETPLGESTAIWYQSTADKHNLPVNRFLLLWFGDFPKS